MPRIIETTVYVISEHPDPSTVFDRIRQEWHDLGEWVLQDTVESLEAFADHIGVSLDYSLSICPDRSEHITFGETESSLGDIISDLNLSGNCPFTGVCYDETILDCFRNAANDANATLDSVLRDIEYEVIKMLHKEGDYLYSDEGLREMCEANEYEFDESGAIS